MYLLCMTGPVTYSNIMHAYSFSEKGWCLGTVLCCKGSWDSHAYSNPLLDMAALNRRRACSTQGWFVFHVFFFSSSSSFKHLQHILIKALPGIYFTLAAGSVHPWYPSTSQLNGAVHQNERSQVIIDNLGLEWKGCWIISIYLSIYEKCKQIWIHYLMSHYFFSGS